MEKESWEGCRPAGPPGAPPAAFKSGSPHFLPSFLSGPLGPGPSASTHISYTGLCSGVHWPEVVPQPWQVTPQKTRLIPRPTKGGGRD